jgi:hypothetical protein
VEAAITPSPTETPVQAPAGVSAQGTSSEPVAEGVRQLGHERLEQDDGERGEDGRYLSREAASYRRRLREAEAERDQLREQVDRLQRVEVARIASGAGLAVAEDVWMHGATLEALRGDDGGIDSATVEGVVEAILKDRPGLRGQPGGDLGIGRGAGARDTTRAPKVGLSALLKPGAG